MSKILKQFSKLNNKKTDNPLEKKMVKHFHKDFIKEGIKCKINTLEIGEIHVKTTVRCHFILIAIDQKLFFKD